MQAVYMCIFFGIKETITAPFSMGVFVRLDAHTSGSRAIINKAHLFKKKRTYNSAYTIMRVIYNLNIKNSISNTHDLIGKHNYVTG